MSKSKEKDYVLTQLAENLPPHQVVGMTKYADTLEADGNISILSSENGFIIRAFITDKGARFLENGGYTAAMRKSKYFSASLKPLRKELWVLIWAVIAGLIIAYLSKRLGWT